MGWPGPMTWRQYATWQAWLELDMDIPSRSDFYQMQTAATVEAGHSRKRVDVNKKKITFGRPKKAAPTRDDIKARVADKVSRVVGKNSKVQVTRVKISKAALERMRQQAAEDDRRKAAKFQGGKS